MRHAILIHTHRYPEQFVRLCGVLRHPDFDIYVNVDRDADIEQFRSLVPDATYIKNRIHIKWGHWSQVEATINSMREIVGSGKEYGYVLFISGQDYPIVPLGVIGSYLDAHHGSEFICGLTADPDPRKQLEWDNRYKKRWCIVMNPRNTPRQNWKRTHRLSRVLLQWMPDRKPPYELYKGSSWWNLTTGAIRYLLDYWDNNPELIRRWQHSLCTDELFFQSTLMASPFRAKLVDNDFRYTDWRGPVEYPKVLGKGDYDAIVASGAWFARKLDFNRDMKIFNMLDEHRSLP